MKSIDAGMQVMLNAAAGGHMTVTALMEVTRRDGQIFRFCELSRNIVYAGNTYFSALGYTRSDVQTSDALDVDNMNVKGGLNSDSITEDDIRAGKWDFARFRLFMVNYENLAQGEIKMRRGRFGEITKGRNDFEAELRGMMQAYSRVIGRIYGPSCDATLGDSRCTKDLTAFTVTGTLEDVSDDQLTLYDSARTEPGPDDSVATIVAITQAAPGVVTTAGPHGFIEGQAIIQHDIVGMTAANGAQVVHNPTDTTYEIVDTSDFDAYVSGGTAVPFTTSGYFDYGVITMTSGEASGLSMEVKSYVPGVIVLQLPFGFDVAPGDNYSLKAGCDKQRTTCVDKFDNVVNFRGFPDLRGNDALVQVGRHS